jgi:HSP20 family protein
MTYLQVYLPSPKVHSIHLPAVKSSGKPVHSAFARFSASVITILESCIFFICTEIFSFFLSGFRLFGPPVYTLLSLVLFQLKNKEDVMTTGIMKKTNGNASTPATSFSGLVDQVFQNNLSRFFEDDFWGFDRAHQRFTVPVNLRETGTGYEMELVAPGLKKEDFKINVNGDLLTVSFEHAEEKNTGGTNDRWLRREHRLQSFTRSFNLDDTLDAGKITAKYSDGILHLGLPRKEGAQRISRNIEIK